MSRLATVGILSIGDMGTGLAKLLVASNYRVVTNLEGRSPDSYTRAKNAQVEALPTDISLVSACDYVFSIVPPRDAIATAQRVITGFLAQPTPKKTSFYYLDLNAISPCTAREISTLFASSTPAIKFIDGGIIGSTASLKVGKVATGNVSENWNRPSIPVSGPAKLEDAPISGAHLSGTLNIKHISPDIGPASGLKMCFASVTKGFTALCVQSFTTASELGVLDELKDEMSTRVPKLWETGSRGVVGMPPKAYRWVKEMEEISATHAEDGGFEGNGKGVFDGIAQVYRTIAEETVLGDEKTERRKRGLTVDDLAGAIGESLQNKRKKAE